MRTAPGKHSRGRQRGAALLIAIAVAGLLTAIALEVINISRKEGRLVEAYRDELRAEWAVRAPVAELIAAIQGDQRAFNGFTSEWARLGETLRVGDVPVRFLVQDEAGKLNLNGLASGNKVTREATERALRAVFEQKDVRQELVDALADWVDADDEERVSGDEGAYYRSLPNPYPVRNAPLIALTGLRLVRGFTPEALRALDFPQTLGRPDPVLHDQFTVYTDGKLNVNTVDPDVLRNLIEGLPERFVEDLVETRKERPVEKALDLKQFEGMNDELFNKLAPFITVKSAYFSVRAEATAGGMRKRLVAVVHDEGERVSVLYWRLY